MCQMCVLTLDHPLSVPIILCGVEDLSSHANPVVRVDLVTEVDC